MGGTGGRDRRVLLSKRFYRSRERTFYPRYPRYSGTGPASTGGTGGRFEVRSSSGCAAGSVPPSGSAPPTSKKTFTPCSPPLPLGALSSVPVAAPTTAVLLLGSAARQPGNPPLPPRGIPDERILPDLPLCSGRCSIRVILRRGRGGASRRRVTPPYSCPCERPPPTVGNEGCQGACSVPFEAVERSPQPAFAPVPVPLPPVEARALASPSCAGARRQRTGPVPGVDLRRGASIRGLYDRVWLDRLSPIARRQGLLADSY